MLQAKASLGCLFVASTRVFFFFFSFFVSSVNQDPTETYMLRDLIISTRQAVFFGGPAVEQFSYYFLLTLHFSAF